MAIKDKNWLIEDKGWFIEDKWRLFPVSISYDPQKIRAGRFHCVHGTRGTLGVERERGNKK